MKKVSVKPSMYCDMHNPDQRVHFMMGECSLVAHTPPHLVTAWPHFLRMRQDREEFFGWRAGLREIP